MLNTPYPNVQAAGNQMIDMLESLIDAYTSIATLIGVLLLLLLICLCIAELRQPAKAPKRTLGAKPPGGRRLLGALLSEQRQPSLTSS